MYTFLAITHNWYSIKELNLYIYFFIFTVGDVTYVELFENGQGKSKGQG